MTITVNLETNTVTMTREDYEELYEDFMFLNCLHNKGVDNWDGYDFAVEEFNSQRNNEDE